MAEATPVTKESTMNRNSSHQIVSDLKVAEIHLQQMTVLPMGRQNQQILHLVKTNFKISLVSYFQQRK